MDPDLSALKHFGTPYETQDIMSADGRPPFTCVTTGNSSYAVTHPDHPGEIAEVPTACTDPGEAWPS